MFQEGYKPKLTHCGNNLCFQTELIGKASSKVAHPTSTVSSNIWHLANAIEHVPTGEQQDYDETDGGPEIAVLYNRKDIRPCHAHKCHST